MEGGVTDRIKVLSEVSKDSEEVVMFEVLIGSTLTLNEVGEEGEEENSEWLLFGEGEGRGGEKSNGIGTAKEAEAGEGAKLVEEEGEEDVEDQGLFPIDLFLLLDLERGLE